MFLYTVANEMLGMSGRTDLKTYSVSTSHTWPSRGPSGTFGSEYATENATAFFGLNRTGI